MKQQLIDTDYAVETPEAIDLEINLSGTTARALAYSIDLSIRFAILGAVFIVLGLLGRAGFGLFLVISFLFEWFYPILFEVFRGGQTPGKRCFNIAVVNQNLTPVTLGPSLIRNLLRSVDFLPSFYLVGIVSMSVSRSFQRLGDLAAGTVVVYRPKIDEGKALPDVPERAPNAPLSLEEQDALVGFAQRHASLTEQRKIELANILAEQTGKEDLDAVRHLQGIGRWLLGGKR